MSRRLAWILLIVLVPGAFLAGSRFVGISHRSREPGERSVLYWVDPMNPRIHSSAPGIAPCGMPFEPVYADGRPAAAASGSRAPSPPPGSVTVLPEVQQLAGVRVEEAQIRGVTTTLRLFGRVVADESRVYRLYSVTDGWIRQVSTAATGTYVKKDELLASYYSPEIPGPQQAFISALDALDRLATSGSTNADQLELSRKTARTAKQQLLNLGMGETQIEEIARTRTVAQTVELRSPASGFLLARNASMGQRFDRTSELYVIADLERVWVVADASGDDVEQLVPGTRAVVRVAGSREAIPAVVSGVLPRFDPATKALKVRLEAPNSRFALRPDMFVDVEAVVTRHRALVVPTAAVLDSGLQKTVFVDRGGGAFERRPVETGWRAGGFVEIAAGLAAGERVAVSGNFLLDSESRMRLVGPAAPASAVDLPRPPP
jgi:membrane fusion protein, copper/silver efflux system